MGIHRGPNIVTDGLVYAVDASSTRSFNFFETAVEVLVIAGGGGGGVGSNGGGGGGAGGFVYNPSYSLSSLTSVSVTIGAGGAGSTGRGSGANGANSVFGAITATGGGRGGGHGNGGGSTSPNTGGSGGGGSYSATGAAGVSGQGNTGGSGAQSLGTPTPNDGGGGGGGAGAVGVNAAGSGGPGGAGGAGKSFNISGTPIVYAGGGGGASNNSSTISAGGTGGGGTGGGNADPNKSGTNAIANSGSGGGGGNGGGGNSGAGGSGVVIIRYVGKPKATGGTITSVGGYTIHTFTSSGTFSSSNLVYDIISNASGTLTNGVAFSNENEGTWDFDGVDNYINFGNNFLVPGISQYDTITNFTIDVWVNWDSFAATGSHDEIISWWKTGSSTYVDGFLGTTRTGGGTAANPVIRFGDGWGNTGVTFTSATDTGKWFNIVAIKTSNNAYVYVNGVLRATKGSALSWGFNDYPAVGRHPNLGEWLDGKVSNIKLYNTALTAAQVTQNFNAKKSRFGL